MIAVALGLTYWGIWPFVVLVILGVTAMCWEWSNLVRSTNWDVVLGVHVLAVWTACALTGMGAAALGVLALAIGCVIVGLLRFSRASFASWSGVLYVGLPAVVLIWLRTGDAWGVAAVLLVFAVVWACDTAAYAAGRSVGGPKLWPRVSPKKTWSGFVGGLVAAGVVGSLFALFLDGASAVRLAGVGLALGLASQFGDLAESALKRAFEVKDSSSLIPGHGGILDRVDGLVTAALMAALIVLATDFAEPARALLFGRA